MNTCLLVYPNIHRLFENLHVRESYTQRVSNSARVTEPERVPNVKHDTRISQVEVTLVFGCSDTPPAQVTSGMLQFT
jgi:hypothetical protein